LAAILSIPQTSHCFRAGLHKAPAEEDHLGGLSAFHKNPYVSGLASTKPLLKKTTLAAIHSIPQTPQCFRAGLHKAAAEEDHLGGHSQPGLSAADLRQQQRQRALPLCAQHPVRSSSCLPGKIGFLYIDAIPIFLMSLSQKYLNNKLEEANS
jgi:hypothetical protein